MKPGVRQRVVAAEMLHRITDQGAYSNVVVANLPDDLPSVERQFVHHLVMATVRNLIRWDAAVESLSGRDTDAIDPLVLAILRVLAQEVLGDERAAHGAVDSAVEATQELGLGRARGFVNAIGRRLAEAETPERPGDGGFDLGIPQWMFDRVSAARGAAAAREFFAASNEPARVGVRVRPTRQAPEGITWVEGIPGAGYVARPPRPGPIDLIDPASTAVAHAVAAAPGMRVVDLAAAPGGKTAALWDAMAGEGRLVAVDIHERRLERTRRRLAALDVEPEFLHADARSTGLEPESWDRVLLDAPCSGLGTLRRRPEIRHRVRPENPDQLAGLQTDLIAAALKLLRQGGRLVYSVCTIFAEETIDVVAPFGGTPPDLPGDVWGGGRLLGPDSTGTDGMFISIVERSQ
jgi:16S rRNA (cytosine967-C5)-methyltransferase